MRYIRLYSISRVEGNFWFHLHWNSLYIELYSVIFSIAGVHFILSPSFKKAEISLYIHIHTHIHMMYIDPCVVFTPSLCYFLYTYHTCSDCFCHVFPLFFFPWVYIYLYRHCVHLPCTTYVSRCFKEYIRDLRCEWCMAARLYFFNSLQLTIKQLFTVHWACWLIMDRPNDGLFKKETFFRC